MLISHSHKFIFIHIYKNGGSSINHALANYNYYSWKKAGIIDKARLISRIYPPIYSQHFEGHINAFKLKKRIPNSVYEAYFKFAFVRHPVEWQKSLYRYAMQDPNHHQHQLTSSFQNFDAYIDWRVDGNFHTQNSFVVDDQGNTIVDFIGKLESFEEDFKKVLHQLNIKSIDLPHSNRSNSHSVDVSSYARGKIEKCFESDYQMFGYN